MYEITTPQYFNRLSSETQFKDYKQLLFRSNDILQSAEVNEVQGILKNDFSAVASRFIENGNFINGGMATVAKEKTGNVNEHNVPYYNVTFSMESGTLFFNGEFLQVPERTTTLNDVLLFDVNLSLGVMISYSEVSASDDSSLLEPANNIRNYNQEGALRLKIVGEWKTSNEIPLDDITYVKIWNVQEGIIDGDFRDPFDIAVIEVIAEYDREARGNYLVDGYKTSFITSSSYIGDFRFQITEGKADIDGYKVSRDFTSEFIIPELLDYELKQSEPIIFNKGAVEYEVNHFPIRKLFRVSGEKNFTQNISHGSYSGASDSFPHTYTPVVRINSVTQGVTTFTEGVDFVQDGDDIRWSLSGNEPAPGSTYTIEWDYRETQSFGDFSGSNGAVSVEKQKVFLEGYNNNSIVSVDYDFVLERTDVLTLSSISGRFKNVKGVPREFKSIAPVINDSTQISLAEIILSGDKDPQVFISGQRVFKMEDIEKLYDNIRDTEYNIGRMGLKMDLKGKDNSLKNVFIDSFENDNFRDYGLESMNGYIKALTVGGDLTFNIDWQTHSTIIDNLDISTGIIPNNTMTVKLNRTGVNSRFLFQPYHTDTIKIAGLIFAVAPDATLRVSPSTYRWLSDDIFKEFLKEVQATTRTNWTWGKSWNVDRRRSNISSSLARNEVTFNTPTPRIIPQIPLRLISKVGDFNSNEQIEISWSGVKILDVTASPTGQLDETFNVPSENVSGNKHIHAKGLVSKVEGSTAFFAQPLTRVVTETTTTIWRNIITITRRPPPPPKPAPVPVPPKPVCPPTDPIAQSFTIGESDLVLDSLKVWFGAAPTTTVFVEIVETEVGFPDNSRILARTEVSHTQITANSAHVFEIDELPVLLANTTYAFIVGCNDPVATLQYATLGERDNEVGKWITSQPYNEGVMFKSSNDRTWSELQKSDVRFELFSTGYETAKLYRFKKISVTDISDVMFSNIHEVDKGCNIEYEFHFHTLDEIGIMSVSPLEQISLNHFTGEIQLVAHMTSNGQYSPEMDIHAEIFTGETSTTSTYSSVAFGFDPNDVRTVVYIDSVILGNAEFTLELEVKRGGVWSWVELTPETTKQLRDGWKENKFVFDIQNGNVDVDQDTSRVRINLSSTDNYRDKLLIQNLRLNNINI